jgi:hypothetical protein
VEVERHLGQARCQASTLGLRSSSPRAPRAARRPRHTNARPDVPARRAIGCSTRRCCAAGRRADRSPVNTLDVAAVDIDSRHGGSPCRTPAAPLRPTAIASNGSSSRRRTVRGDGSGPDKAWRYSVIGMAVSWVDASILGRAGRGIKTARRI